MLAGEPRAGAPEASVNFVEDEQRAGLVADPPQHGEEVGRRNIDSAPRLHRFDEDRPEVVLFEQTPDVGFRLFRRRGLITRGERHEVTEITELIPKRRSKMFAVRGVKRAVAQPMIRALERNHAGFSGGETCGFQRRLHRFEAGIAEDGFAPRSSFGLGTIDSGPLFKSDLAQLPREPRLQFMRMHVAHGMQERAHLLLPGAHDMRVRMAGRRHAECCRQVEILASFHIPDEHAARPVPDDGPGAVRFHESHVARFVSAQEVEGGLSFHFLATDGTRMKHGLGNANSTPPARRLFRVPSVFHPWLFKHPSPPAARRICASATGSVPAARRR